MATLRDTFNVEYYNISKERSKPVSVHLFLRGNQPKLQIAKVADRKSSILDEIWMDNIGALVLHKIKTKRRKFQQCLFIFWKSSEEEKKWDQMIFMDRPNAEVAAKGVEQLKVAVSVKCFHSASFKMKDKTGEVAYLQCTRRFMAITPENGTRNLRRAEVAEFCTQISASIYAKCNGEISLIEEPSSCTSVIRLRTVSGQTLQYTLTNGRTADMISREINATPEPRDPASPLPPTPSVQPQPAPPTLIPRDCGAVPPIGEKPFWIDRLVPINPEDPADTSSIYRSDAILEPYIRNKMRHIQQVCRRQPSKRFHEFIDVVKIKPTMVDAAELSAQQAAEPVYRRARLSRLVTEQPTISTTKFCKDNVENTLADCLKKIVRRNFDSGSVDICPIGMTHKERETFCWRLDLVENTIDMVGWKAFACSVMSLDNDDLEMIDEFSCKYKCQVVEVVLDHWYKLYKMKSDKCLHAATKQTIVEVLTNLEKDELLYRLNWT